MNNINYNEEFLDARSSIKAKDIQRLVHRSLSGGARTLHARKAPLRRLGLIAASIVLMLSISMTALAATGVIDFGAFYNSLFASDKASPYVASRNEISASSNGDLSIEPLAAILDDERLYIQLKITGLSSKTLPDSLYFFNNGQRLDIGDGYIISVDDNTVIANIMVFARNIDDGKIELRFDKISAVYDDSGMATSFSGDWDFLIPADKLLKTKILDDVFIGYGTRVLIGATLLKIEVFSDFSKGGIDFDYMAPGAAVLNLKDGTTVPLTFSGQFTDNRVSAFDYNMEFVNPIDVVSVAFCGVTLTDQFDNPVYQGTDDVGDVPLTETETKTEDNPIVEWPTTQERTHPITGETIDEAGD